MQIFAIWWKKEISGKTYSIASIRLNCTSLHCGMRGNDIILLAEYFLQRYARKYQKEMRGLTREAKVKLLRYPWPGNVRELQHTMERAVILGDGSLLRPDNFLFQASSPRPKKEEEVLQSGAIGTAGCRKGYAIERREYDAGRRVSGNHALCIVSED